MGSTGESPEVRRQGMQPFQGDVVGDTGGECERYQTLRLSGSRMIANSYLAYHAQADQILVLISMSCTSMCMAYVSRT